MQDRGYQQLNPASKTYGRGTGDFVPAGVVELPANAQGLPTQEEGYISGAIGNKLRILDVISIIRILLEAVGVSLRMRCKLPVYVISTRKKRTQVFVHENHLCQISREDVFGVVDHRGGYRTQVHCV